jgi:hypothetical protein
MSIAFAKRYPIRPSRGNKYSPRKQAFLSAGLNTEGSIQRGIRPRALHDSKSYVLKHRRAFNG